MAGVGVRQPRRPGMADSDPRELILASIPIASSGFCIAQTVGCPSVTTSEPSVAVASEHRIRTKCCGFTASQTVPRRSQGESSALGNHIDTDAIIPGQFCHLTDFK